MKIKTIDSKKTGWRHLVGRSLVAVLLAIPLTVGAQANRQVSGTVRDEAGGALAGVTVQVKGGSQTAVTDARGAYNLQGVPSDAVLDLFFVGMQRQEVPVNGRSTVDVTMQPDAIGLEDVVVVGYATQKRVNVIGSVSTISAEALDSRPITNLSNALAGLASGVYVRSSSGKPGGDGADILIRGTGTISSTSPLVIVDGIAGSTRAINPGDVESVSVLKDAATAAIYGSLASNGVILITTKSGSTGGVSVNYTGNLSITRPNNLPGFVDDYPTHMRLVNEGYVNIGQAPVYTEATMNAWEEAKRNPNALAASGVPNYVAYPNTTWSEHVFQNKILQNHNLSLRGGNTNTQYLFSMGYMYNPGTIPTTEADRYQLRINLQSKVADFLTVGTQTFGHIMNQSVTDVPLAFQYLTGTVPGVYPVWDGKFGYPAAAEESATANNPMAQLNSQDGANQETVINTTVFANFDILPGLRFEMKAHYDNSATEQNMHNVPTEKWNFATGLIGSAAISPSQQWTQYQLYKSHNVILDNVLRYNTTIADKHVIGAIAGYNQHHYKHYNFTARKTGLLDSSLTTLNTATTMTSIGGDANDWALRSWFGRASYAYDDRYLFEAVMRYDGSSRFAPESRWGFFPALSAGWRLSEESFMQDFNRIIDNLKLRVSWGKTGNNASGNYDYQATYNTVQYSFGGTANNGLAQTKSANPFLQWETTTTTNIGLSGTALRGAFNFELDLYHADTDGILFVPTIPLTTGTAAAATQNIAQVTKKGIELTLGYQGNLSGFRYSVSGNVAYNHNKVVKYKGLLEEGYVTDTNGNEVYQSNIGSVSTGTTERILEGHRIREQYLYPVYRGDGSYNNSDGSVNVNGGPKDGMIRTQGDMEWLQAMFAAGYIFQPSGGVEKSKIWYGDLIYADANGDGIYGNAYDQKFMNTTAAPKWNYGLNANFAWKGIDLSMIWAGNAGMSYHWNEIYMNNSTVGLGKAVPTLVSNDRYYYNDTNPSDPANNTGGKYPRLKTTDPQNGLASDFYLYDASYLKLKSLQLGYTIPEKITKKARISQARIFIGGENLLTITRFPGIDPEVGPVLTYPTMRQYTLGLNITF